jgi:hypothetical protein
VVERVVKFPAVFIDARVCAVVPRLVVGKKVVCYAPERITLE